MNISIFNYRDNSIINRSLAFNGTKTQKLIATLVKSKNLKKIEITFEELERMYNEIGYDVVRKRGSHASVTLNEKYTISIVMPHGEKYVKPNDLKRFLLIKEGKLEEAVAQKNYTHHH